MHFCTSVLYANEIGLNKFHKSCKKSNVQENSRKLPSKINKFPKVLIVSIL